ncbi:MAG: YbcC family protein [Bacteroidota bacterium]
MEDTNITERLNSKVKNQESLSSILRKASKKIAPVWSLESSVAVNPFLGLTEKKFDDVAQELNLMAGIHMTMPTSFYLEKIRDGKLTHEDISKVLEKRNREIKPVEFLISLENKMVVTNTLDRIQTVADAAEVLTKKDWNSLVMSRVSSFSASFFDKGQASLTPTKLDSCLFKSWKEEATIDRTPELLGLKNFRKTLKAYPDNPFEASQYVLNKLGIPKECEDVYLHTVLLRSGGWSSYAAQIDWVDELYGRKDGKVLEFLAVLLCWELCLLESIQHDGMTTEWESAKNNMRRYSERVPYDKILNDNLILQEAFDLAEQNKIIHSFNKKQPVDKKSQKVTKTQAVFCIDVRSEVYRRNLEMVDDDIETMGFAGFFGFPIQYVPIGNEIGEAQCPVLLKAGHTILEDFSDNNSNRKILQKRVLTRQFQQVWKSFKSGAITCFGYVSPIGLSYLPKLFTDSFGWTRPVPDPNGAKNKSQNSNIKVNYNESDSTGIPLDKQIEMAKNALTAMSLTDDFGKLVLIVGHGSTMVNNPHATGYNCGACGGHTGEANAKVAAMVLNNIEVRKGLLNENIIIPVTTLFLACLHDTTTDEITIYNEGIVPAERLDEISELKKSLNQASQGARTERFKKLDFKMEKDSNKSILKRSKDWSQIRPEWGLAGCSSFIVAPRHRSKNINFEGRSFLHSYNWKEDNGFAVLEQIMTAPMVVTSWISLQYFASTVDNKVYGSGNKALHNVTSGLGVIEGYSGDLRIGLPWQAIHDGENYSHEPLKLNVIIESPIDAINAVLEKHSSIKDLFDNNWMNLLVMDDDGRVSYRYTGKLNWQKIN